MAMNLPPPSLNLTTFYCLADNLSQEEAERVAEAFPDMFKSAFEYGAAPSACPPQSAKPGPAKARAPKTETPIDKDALKETCLAYVRARPASKAEDVATALGQPGPAVKKALESLVDDKALSCEGARRGRKYTAMTPRPQEEAEAAE